MEIFKIILGIIVITHISPFFCVGITILDGGIIKYGYLVPYLAGWGFNAFILICYAIIELLVWCFN